MDDREPTLQELLGPKAARQEALLAALATRNREKFRVYFPDCQPSCIRTSKRKQDHAALCLALYEKPQQFFDGGREFPERVFLAGNRTGKTETAAFEMVCHTTGVYPRWWKGRKFDKPVKCWAAGDTMLSTRDILQVSLCGSIDTYDTELWNGMLPRHTIHSVTRKSGGVPKCLHEVWINHVDEKGVADGRSLIEFKSFDQGRRLFQGTEQDVVWIDEECPEEVYTECLLRTMTTRGLIMVTFTPLQGLTPFVQAFLQSSVMPDVNGELKPSFDQFFDAEAAAKAPEQETTLPSVRPRLLISATWDDAPHLDDEAKKQLLVSIPEYQRDARTKGIPQLGAGAVYPFPESQIRVSDFELPRFWPRAFGFDCALAGTTAAAWGALDRETGILYIYSVYRRSQAETAVHAEAFKARGLWIPAVGDAADIIDADRFQFIDRYRAHGFHVELPDKSVETGIQSVYDRLSSGTLKVFASCTAWFEEFRLYQRDDRGRIVKKNDHIMDATRYLIHTGIRRALPEPKPEEDDRVHVVDEGFRSLSWMR